MKDLITLCYIKSRLFLKREDGASAIEYGIIAGLIAVVIIAAAAAIGTDVKEIFEKISTDLSAASA
ncbi:Flp family type IVb pilin [Pseudomonas sp. ABC1]|uniref:Flp family type IVb pilin n=1 Tax=Pseudomonas sp. ABC1 TaxID=2748080 RepID=UPI0015C3E732|nr:Flp family type IVb pilin [Pseudomonas sp. ABC1]QLF93147.1 Flp family type IVb pilin [Pseudomonas sp. ABC1]